MFFKGLKPTNSHHGRWKDRHRPFTSVCIHSPAMATPWMERFIWGAPM